MKQSLTAPRRLLVGVLASCLLALSAVADAVEKKKLTYSTVSRTTVSEIKAHPGDGRELTQGIYSDKLKSSDPEWNGGEERVFDQTEQVQGTGTHRGTSVNVLRSGDMVYQQFSGSHKTTMRGDAWETTYEGTSDIVGGTGKYKNAKGRVMYKGRVTPQGIEAENIVDIEY